MSPKQEQVLALISAGSTISQAAQSAGVHRNTIYHWRMSSLAFHLNLELARESKAIFWREEAQELAGQAIETIRSIMDNPQAPASIRLKAALAILNMATTMPALSAVAERPESVHNSAQSEPGKIGLPAGQPLSEPGLPAGQPPRPTPKIGRNELCPCGSGKKFKRCCLDKPAPQPLAPDADPVFQTAWYPSLDHGTAAAA